MGAVALIPVLINDDHCIGCLHSCWRNAINQAAELAADLGIPIEVT
jgi:hypothetical protein